MENYFNEVRWKIMRANNLLQFIHQITIEFRFRNSLAQERFKSNLEFRYQFIVSSIRLRKCFAKFMIPIALIRSFWVNKSATWLVALAKSNYRKVGAREWYFICFSLKIQLTAAWLRSITGDHCRNAVQMLQSAPCNCAGWARHIDNATLALCELWNRLWK